MRTATNVCRKLTHVLVSGSLLSLNSRSLLSRKCSAVVAVGDRTDKSTELYLRCFLATQQYIH
jgi:hypothetical protein